MTYQPILYIIFLLCFSITGIRAQIIEHDRLLSFEGAEVPAYISGEKSELSISGKHFKDGSKSLVWDFEANGIMTVKKDLKFETKDPTGADTYLSTFIVWVYNETPIDGYIRFEFLKDGQKCTSFPFKINFKGWRTAWVCYERDMEGVPQEGMNEIRIVAPDAKGKLYIDHLLTAAKTDRRHQTADLQVPFVNATNDNHWLVVLKRSQLKPDIALEQTVSDLQAKDAKLIEQRFKEIIYTPAVFKPKDMENIKKRYQKYGIKNIDGQISGLSIFFGRAAEAYERLIPAWNKNMITTMGIEVKEYFDFMYKVAVAYNNAQKQDERKELETIFLNLYDHITDQGFAYGSCLGNFTHYGYSFRNLYTSYFLMKDVLFTSGRLTEAQKTMQWYAMTNEVYQNPTTQGMDIDSFNTVTTGRIASILIMEDSPEKIQYLKSFSRWINNGCLPAPGLAGSFKPDGAVFHHCNNYPAYAVGGLNGATNMIYLLSRTSFAVSVLAHQTVKNSLLTMRFYCNEQHFPLSMSGRHPDGRGQLVPVQFAYMAVAGSPDGENEVDKEMSEAFLRLVGKGENNDLPEYVPQTTNRAEQKFADYLSDKGFKAEKTPQGNIALGYGCVSVLRRGNWSAVARGHSRYLWAAEHYLGANLYGRYLAHGSLQIMKSNDKLPVTPTTSGWQQAGFDWGRIPGTTAIHLPVEQLKANVLNVDTCSGFEEMLYSDEAFAGGLSQEGENGVFAMKLHEHDKYNGSHRARKSFHLLGDKIICLGSDIENSNNEYNTETTIFQTAIMNDKDKEYWKNLSFNKSFLVDHLNTGYYIPNNSKNKNLLFEKNYPQHSRMQNTGKETQGDWVTLAVDHGKMPRNESYEYVLFPETDWAKMKAFAQKPTYKVLMHNKDAHIIHDIEENTISYALFEPANNLPGNQILSVDTSCLMMLKQYKEYNVLTVCNPDLALYKGPSDEAFDENGKRMERSIYSRPWIGNPSQTMPIVVRLKGEWNIAGSENWKILKRDKNETILQVLCKDGASYDIKMTRNK
ncbi:chondroitinase family polysaccharide lyase [Dysgonomonas sp. 511]|uniref:chondroitinase family polysaccharide lyase n=1 Tax=Dysgonomonas sp. 511 TaxID=2302930 RepID=UPI0013D8DD05|nr:chondroitinase family polysaccharide lyase [Dysgonomonas sp. 511]NDV79909.1 chondroitinase [Dysgonomonas sp. 511]